MKSEIQKMVHSNEITIVCCVILLKAFYSI